MADSSTELLIATSVEQATRMYDVLTYRYGVDLVGFNPIFTEESTYMWKWIDYKRKYPTDFGYILH